LDLKNWTTSPDSTLWNFIGLEELDNFPKFKHFGTSLDLKNSTTSSNSTLFEFQFGA
jgi:hypothetical protein